MPREKLFSVSLSDCRVETFTVGGHGGSGKDTSNTGVRITHPPSGAVGIGRDERSQLQNKRAAFRRLSETKAFKQWARLRAAQLSGQKSVDQLVEEDMQPQNLRVEVKDADGRWVPDA
jgi:protein subunit release factor A